MDLSSKLIINLRTCKRNNENTEAFLQDLKSRMDCRFNSRPMHISVMAWWLRGGSQSFRKRRGLCHRKENFRFGQCGEPIFQSPADCDRNKALPTQIGNPDMNLATTCHVERMKMSVSYFQPPIHAQDIGIFKQSLENLRHSIAIMVAHFNFCRDSFGTWPHTGTGRKSDRSHVDN